MYSKALMTEQRCVLNFQALKGEGMISAAHRKRVGVISLMP
jgi:hypothetical protein